MKIKCIATIEQDPSGEHTFPMIVGVAGRMRQVRLSVEGMDQAKVPYDPDHAEPLQIKAIPDGSLSGWWVFRCRVVDVQDGDSVSAAELAIRIKHTVLSDEASFKSIVRQVEAFEKIEVTSSARRERIPETVRLFVWQRDEGRCAKCGSQEYLEFDHIIPVALGGSNTERNIQLLCERCNREKGTRI